jgi:hypothetical protein
MPKIKSTWEQVMSMKKNDNRHQGVANTLDRDDLETICATIDYFGGSWRQAYFDLSIPKYRVFDFLAMCVMGNRIQSDEATKVMVYSFLKVDGDVTKWIDDLRATDYAMERGWESIEI